MIASQRSTTRSKTSPDRVDPSPAMIRRRAAAIQRQWSQHTRIKRAGGAEDFRAVIELPSQPSRRGFSVE